MNTSMNTSFYGNNKRSYVQNQRILRLYSDFLYEDVGVHTEYQRRKSNIDFLEKYNFSSCLIYNTLRRNVSNICRIIRLFAVGNTNIIKNPFSYNGFQLIEMCHKGYKLNCAGCSIVLNDILITLGYKSKCICCVPYETDDINTHVVVHVCDDTNNKWFVADPAMGRVPCDRKGNSMDILTLREYLSEENEMPFYRSGKIILNDAECREYAEELIDKVFMFVVFQNSGLNYDFKSTKIIIPEGIKHISSMYNVSEKTNNTFSMYN